MICDCFQKDRTGLLFIQQIMSDFAFDILLHLLNPEKKKLEKSLEQDYLFPNNLNQYSLSSHAVELAVKDLLPGAEVQFAVCDGNHNFATHDLPLHVRIGIILARAVMLVL